VGRPPDAGPTVTRADYGQILTVPNLISLGRLLGVPLFLWLFLGPHADGWAVAVLAIGGLFDGRRGERVVSESLRAMGDRMTLGQSAVCVGDEPAGLFATGEATIERSDEAGQGFGIDAGIDLDGAAIAERDLDDAAARPGRSGR